MLFNIHREPRANALGSARRIIIPNVNKTPRFAAVDALRGLIMMLMAIDHASGFISRQHSSEFWNGAITVYNSAFPFLTRLVTHLCAPGFFFLMGAGIYWFHASRIAAGWTQSQIVRRTMLRGFALLLAGQLFETPIMYMQAGLKRSAIALTQLPMPPPNDGITPFGAFITLSGLGLVMVICALLLKLHPVLWLGVTALCVILTHALLPASGAVGPAWFTILLAPGLSQGIAAIYPVIPWLAVGAFGMYFGYLWNIKDSTRDRVWLLGLLLVAIAVSVRAFGGWGNIVAARDTSWIEFFNNVKYPPSLVFWTLSVGVNLLLLAVLMRLPAAFTSGRSPLMVFGQTPLFFYILHFYALEAFAVTFFEEAAPLEMTYVIWIVLLAILYPVCAWYRRFKLQKPAESLWRLF